MVDDRPSADLKETKPGSLLELMELVFWRGRSIEMSKLVKRYRCVCFCIVVCIVGLTLFGYYIGSGKFLDVPTFQVREFRLSDLDESLTTSTLNTECNFTMETHNRGKNMHIYYGDFYFSVQWENVNMGYGKVARFSQGSKNTTYFTGILQSSPANQKLNASQQAVLTESRNSGSMALSIDVVVKTRWKDITGLKSDEFDARIECQIAIDPVIASASQLLDQECEVLDFKCFNGC
ncbi:hypothetical protein R1sor_016764 [Riccia sorocarpa]|uniref:Late embryogenesis abundant protein LEA-2 subgroup domain-containing protein n=1 Tax=Riccia sorocarpa TaxID=122646 RepID=A0ABD3HK28_9MARC